MLAYQVNLVMTSQRAITWKDSDLNLRISEIQEIFYTLTYVLLNMLLLYWQSTDFHLS
jgi:hypothetical protein